MDLFKKLYQVQDKVVMDVIGQAGLVTDKDSKIFYVDSVHGSDNYGGRTIAGAKATLAGAYELCTADNHDVIVVLPRHAETVTSVLTIAKAGVSIIGLKQGNLRPTITGNGTIDIISVEAANVLIQGLKFAAPLTDAQTSDINIAGAFCTVRDCISLGSVGTENKVDMITITADGDDALIEGYRAYNTVVECPSCIKLEGAATNVEIRDFFIYDSIGFTNGAIYDAAAATGVYIHNGVVMNAKADTVALNFVANSVGVCSFVHVAGRHTTLASNVVPGTGMNFFEVRAVEQAALNGAVIPAVDTD